LLLKRLVFTCLFLVLQLCYIEVYSQEVFHIDYNIENGLPSSEIYDIVQDSKSNIWVSTDRGVARFNGHDFEQFSTNDGLADNTNFYFNLDNNHNIWLSGFNRKLSYISNDSIHIYKHNASIIDLLHQRSGSWVRYLNGDSNGYYFILYHMYESPEVFKFNKNSPPFKEKDTDYKELELEGQIFKVVNLLEDKYCVYNSFQETYKSSKFISDINGNSFFHTDNKIVRLDSTGNVDFYTILEPKIENIYLDNDNGVWACTRKGLMYYESGIENSPIVFFEESLISAIMQDFQGNYWVGTNDSGIKLIPSLEIENISKRNQFNTNESILSSSKYINSIAFGTSKGGLILCDNFGNCSTKPVPYISSNSQINFLGEWENNSLIMTAGVSYQDINGKEPSFDLPKVTPLSSSKVFQRILHNNDVVLFTRDSRFKIFDRLNNRVISSNTFKNPINSNLNALTQDSLNNVYFGTMNGLYKVVDYDYQNIYELKNKGGLGFGRISDIHVDGKNLVWITTIGNGVFCIKNNDIIQINDIEAISSLMVNKVVSVKDSMLWLATNTGIDVLSYNWNDTLSIKFQRNINNTDGLVSNFVNDLEYWNDYIWAATNRGICRFSPNIVNSEVPQLPIYITNFANNDSTYNFNQELDFKYNQNDVLISYNGLSFQQQKEPIEYKYRLIKNGSNDNRQWYYTNDRNQRFNNLNPGNYIFEVNAKNKLRIWNNKPATVKFFIQPHFTQTSWFKVLVGILVILGIYLTYIFQLKRFERKQERERALVKAKQKMQEAELAAIRNQMNPHFVFNSLNSIQNFIFKKDVIKSNYYLSKFAGLMRQSLQFSRLDFISIVDEVEFLTDYLTLESLRFKNKFEFKFNIDERIDKEATLLPSLILQPLIENSIKHGFNNIDGTGKIKVDFYLSDGKFLQIDVADNGLGSASVKNTIGTHKSLGINMIKNRISLLNQSKFDNMASVRFEERTNGYFVFFKIPLIIDEKVL